MKETPLGTNPPPLFGDRPGPGLEPVGGDFQPPFAIAHPGGGALLICVLKALRRPKLVKMACKIKAIWSSAIFLRPPRTSERWGCFPMRIYSPLLQENLEKALLMGVKIMSKT
jgi:hypothetical protein